MGHSVMSQEAEHFLGIELLYLKPHFLDGIVANNPNLVIKKLKLLEHIFMVKYIEYEKVHFYHSTCK